MFQAYGYDLVEKRGGGRGAESYLVRAHAGEELALATVAKAKAKAQDSERLARLVTRLSELSLPCVVPARGSGVVEGRAFVVSEELPAETLQAHLTQQGPLTPDELVLLALPLCGTLEALRAQGILVTRLLPEQVLLEGGLAQVNPKLLAPMLYAEALDPAQAVRSRADVRAIGLLLRSALDDLRGGGPVGLKATVAVDAGDRPVREVIDRCLTEDPAVGLATPAEVGRALAEKQPSTLVARSEPAPVEEAAAPAPLEREGDVLGNYALEQLVGEGAMGRVFLARHLRLGRQVAVKVLRPEHGRNPSLVQRFFQEAQAVNQINHEHIVEIHDFAEESLPRGERRAYCVLEALCGESLADRSRRAALPIPRALRIIRQVCAALAAAHQVGVVHRDVKPDNLFLIQRGGDPDFLKVLDFGVAKLTSPAGGRDADESIEGTIVGTPMYMAPEQAAGMTTDARTDVYAVGTVLYELLSGHTPFTGATFGQLAAQLITHAPPPLPRFTPAGERIPYGLRAAVMRCLEKEPAARFQTMDVLSAALAPFEQRRAVRPIAERLAVGGAALALLLMVAFAVGHRSEPRPVAQASLGAPLQPRPVAIRAALPRLPVGRWVAPLPRVKLDVESTPAGAKVTRVDTGQELGVTPLSVVLPRQDSLVLRLSYRGRMIERRVRPVSDLSLRVELPEVRTARAPAPQPTASRPTVDPFAL